VENESRQSWVLIGIATVGLALGVIALIVAFDARSSADDAASQKSVDEVSTQLSNLIDRLGITEESLTGEQKVLQGKAQKVEKETRDAVANLTKRVNKLEHQNASAEEIAKLTKKIESLETQVANVNSRVTATNKRVNQLSARVNEGG
jgi:chromosome segregation ATPase